MQKVLCAKGAEKSSVMHNLWNLFDKMETWAAESSSEVIGRFHAIPNCVL
jgi:hypothetical protein